MITDGDIQILPKPLASSENPKLSIMFHSQISKRSINFSARPYDQATGLTLEEHIRMESNRAVALSRKGMRSSLSSRPPSVLLILFHEHLPPSLSLIELIW